MTAFAADDYTLHRPRWNDVHLEDSRDYHDDHDYLFFDDDPAISYEINIDCGKIQIQKKNEGLSEIHIQFLKGELEMREG